MKTYVITGATSGIGKALVDYFSKDNFVFASYRDESKLDNIKSDNVIPFYLDYAQPETIKPAVEFIKSKTEKIDTLLNVAGCVVAGAISDIPISELKRQFDVNVFGAVELSQGLLPLLYGGVSPKIINISSMASYGIFPFVSPYCASKRALDILFNSLMLENKHGIKVVSIKPGVIATPLWSKSIQENEKTIDNSTEYKSEAIYLKNNAYENEKYGLSTDKVVSIVVKADRSNSPKPSYCVGGDSHLVSVISRLPQTILNKIIEFKVNRISKGE